MEVRILQYSPAIRRLASRRHDVPLSTVDYGSSVPAPAIKANLPRNAFELARPSQSLTSIALAGPPTAGREVRWNVTQKGNSLLISSTAVSYDNLAVFDNTGKSIGATRGTYAGGVNITINTDSLPQGFTVQLISPPADSSETNAFVYLALTNTATNMTTNIEIGAFAVGKAHQIDDVSHSPNH